MKVFRPKPEKWHNYAEGDAGKPIKDFYKKGFWKRNDRKKFFRDLLKQVTPTNTIKKINNSTTSFKKQSL